MEMNSLRIAHTWKPFVKLNQLRKDVTVVVDIYTYTYFQID